MWFPPPLIFLSFLPSGIIIITSPAPLDAKQAAAHETDPASLDDISTGSIRNRISRLRGQQRALYELHGWAWPDVGTGGGGGGSAKKAGGGGGGGGGGRAKAGKKRDADGGGDASGSVRKKGKVGGGKEAAKNEEEEGVVVHGEEGEGEGASMVDCKEEREEMEDEV